MRQENVEYFTEREEEFINLLIDIGMKTTVAKLLVFLAHTPEATSRDIEHGTDLRQPEVSMAMKYLMEQGWIKSYESSSESKGRPMKVFELSVPLEDIMGTIEIEAKEKAKKQLALVKKMKNYF
jgi:predicted transcriptional regulator